MHGEEVAREGIIGVYYSTLFTLTLHSIHSIALRFIVTPSLPSTPTTTTTNRYTYNP